MSNENQFLVYHDDKQGIRVEARLADGSVWLTQRQIVELFKTAKSTVSEHIKNIFTEEELLPDATVRNIRTVQLEGEREVSRDLDHYNLEMIISLGYRINSKVATRFRQWATQRIKEYLVKGFTLDDERLKSLGGGNYWKELLDRIRDIRSSEKVMYRQVLDLYATATDYDGKSEDSLAFGEAGQRREPEVMKGNDFRNRPQMDTDEHGFLEEGSREGAMARRRTKRTTKGTNDTKKWQEGMFVGFVNFVVRENGSGGLNEKI